MVELSGLRRKGAAGHRCPMGIALGLVRISSGGGTTISFTYSNKYINDVRYIALTVQFAIVVRMRNVARVLPPLYAALYVATPNFALRSS